MSGASPIPVTPFASTRTSQPAFRVLVAESSAQSVLVGGDSGETPRHRGIVAQEPDRRKLPAHPKAPSTDLIGHQHRGCENPRQKSCRPASRFGHGTAPAFCPWGAALQLTNVGSAVPTSDRSATPAR